MYTKYVFKDINTFIQHWCIKSDSKDIYITKDFYFKQNHNCFNIQNNKKCVLNNNY